MTKKIFALLILVCMLSCPAYADIAYMTQNGTLGYIKISVNSSALSADSPVPKYSGFAGDSIAAHFYDESGTSKLIVIEPQTDTRAASGDRALVFNASDLTKIIDNGEKILTGVYDTRSVAYSENHKSIFFASTLNNQSKISEFDTDYIEDLNEYVYVASNDDAEISTVLVTGSSILGLINKATSQDSLFLRFDGQLDDKVSGAYNIKADYDAELIAFINNNNIVLGHSEGVDRLSNGEFLEVISTDNPVKAICRDNSGGFYFIEQSESGDQVLRHYKNSVEITRLTSGKGSISKALYYDRDSKKFAAFIIDDEILIYNPETDALIDDFTSSELGGIPTGITAATNNTSSSNSSGSSGCSLTASGIILMLVLIRKVFNPSRPSLNRDGE